MAEQARTAQAKKAEGNFDPAKAGKETAGPDPNSEVGGDYLGRPRKLSALPLPPVGGTTTPASVRRDDKIFHMRATLLIVVSLFCGNFPFQPARAEGLGGGLVYDASWYPGTGYLEGFAEVLSVKSRTDGAASVQLRSVVDGIVDAKHLTHPVTRPPQNIAWEWPANSGPVPVASGMKVQLKVSPKGEVVSVGYTIFKVRARRQVAGHWEFIVTPYNPPCFLHILARDFGPQAPEVRWVKPYGVLMAAFDDGGYGAGEVQEIETAAMRKVGWPIANEPGKSVVPGRDGWVLVEK